MAGMILDFRVKDVFLKKCGSQGKGDIKAAS